MVDVLGLVVVTCLIVLAIMGTAWIVRQIIKGW